MAFNKRAHLRSNIDAIKTAFLLDRENRTATPEEQAILEDYSGFGGIKAVLNPVNHPGDESHWTKNDLELFGLVTELHEVLREGAGDEAQYKRYVSSLKNSILTAFYTPTEVINVLVENPSQTRHCTHAPAGPFRRNRRICIRLQATIP